MPMDITRYQRLMDSLCPKEAMLLVAEQFMSSIVIPRLKDSVVGLSSLIVSLTMPHQVALQAYVFPLMAILATM